MNAEAVADASGFVIGVDSSTSATKAVALDREGSILGIGRSPIPMANPADLHYEQNADDWRSSLTAALRDLDGQVGLSGAQSIAFSNQRETIAFLAEDGSQVRPGIVWLDARCLPLVADFASAVGTDRFHSLTGKYPDGTPACFRLAWVKRHEPEIYERTQRFADVHAVLTHYLTGEWASSQASADPLGLWDLQAASWAQPVLEQLGIDEARLPRAQPPCSALGQVSAAAAAATGLPEGMTVAAGGGDGQCAGFSVAATEPGTAYLNLGTAAVGGTWQQNYACSRAWRTLLSVSGEGYIMESVLRSGTYLVDWLVKDIFGLEGTGADYAQLEEEASALPPGSGGVLVLPYWLGVMNPHWNSAATGAIAGLAGNHGRAHLYRAVLEGIILEHSLFYEQFEAQARTQIECVSLVGGGANSKLWAQLAADILGKDCLLRETVEASALGAGMAAAVAAGWYPSGAAAAAAMASKPAASYKPGAGASAYDAVRDRYRRMYAASSSIEGANA